MKVNSSVYLKELLDIELMFLEFMCITQMKCIDDILEKIKTEK